MKSINQSENKAGTSKENVEGHKPVLSIVLNIKQVCAEIKINLHLDKIYKNYYTI